MMKRQKEKLTEQLGGEERQQIAGRPTFVQMISKCRKVSRE